MVFCVILATRWSTTQDRMFFVLRVADFAYLQCSITSISQATPGSLTALLADDETREAPPRHFSFLYRLVGLKEILFWPE